MRPELKILAAVMQLVILIVWIGIAFFFDALIFLALPARFIFGRRTFTKIAHHLADTGWSGLCYHAEKFAGWNIIYSGKPLAALAERETPCFTLAFILK